MQPQKSSEPSPRDATHLLRVATYASVLTAVVLVLAKTWAWLDTGAVSLLASLIDSIMDSGASLLNLVAVRFALKPADGNHRFGHGKAEALAALAQSALIFLSCAFLVVEAGERLINPTQLGAVHSGVAVILFSLAATSGLLLLQRHVIRRTRSTAIRADSLHYASDVAANVATLAALVLAAYGVPSADPIFALAIAAWLALSTRSIIRDSLNELLDRELPEEQRQQIISLARAHDDVVDVHDVRTRRSGRTLIIQLHLDLDAELSLKRAHHISAEVEQSLRNALPNADIVIHQDPVGIAEERHWIETPDTDTNTNNDSN